MLIDKTASSPAAFLRPTRQFENARSAFKAFLAASGVGRAGKVLLPGYIGYSSREGSGVFDPVRELHLPSAFYRMGSRLRIDLDHLRDCLRPGDVRLVVLIHYFGYVDPGYAEAVSLARKHGADVLEDEAHALFSDLVGGVCGRLGDAAIFSLHKVLPMKRGGMLLVGTNKASLLQNMHATSSGVGSPWDYDLWGISQARRANAAALKEFLAPLTEDVEPLWPELPEGVVPQTYPVVIRRVSRDLLYEAMNESGFGVVSLYHTMIADLLPNEHPEAHSLAGRILNLPVHQDIDRDSLKALVERLAQCMRALPPVGR
jgi:dTDP-4-amino-4,6-dideoxygalactose transaminase